MKPTKALLVIDMQRDLCYDSRRRNKVQQLIQPLREAIDLFEIASQPIFYICFALPANDEQFKRFGDRYCIEGTEGAEIIPELLPLHGNIIKKKKHSAFFETDLYQMLLELGVKEVFLTGMQTQICIMTTAADASFRGFRAVAIRECVLSTQDESKEYALNWIARYVGEVLSLAEVVKEISSG